MKSDAVRDGDFAKKNFAEKRIAELKPFYSQFCDANKSTPAPAVTQKATTAEHTSHTVAEEDHTAFHFYAVSGSQRAAVLVDRVFQLWKSKSFKRVPAETKLRDHYQIIETIVSNLLYCEAMDHEGVRFSRSEETFAATSRYRPAVFNKRFLTIMDDLHDLGIVHQVKGDRWKASQVRKHFPDQKTVKVYGMKQSYITTGKALTSLMEVLSMTPAMSDVNFINEGREVIILKKGEGSALLEYADAEFPEADKYRKQMVIINEMLNNAGDILTGEAQAIHDQRKRHLVRRFTHSSLESGGRLWEGFWLNGMKREERPTMLRLKGESTVELDFSNMIVRLCYLVAEKPAPAGDQYIIPGLDPASRDGVKRVISTLLFDNNRKRDRFPKEVAQLFTPADRQKGWAYVYKAIRTHHYELRAYLDCGLGHYLQFLESQILINCLIRCAQKGLVALPIHDCLVVPRSLAFRIKGIMGQTVRYMFGMDAWLPVEEKCKGQKDEVAA
ncbi:MAG: hypothetical protein NDI90_04340 [Nitrospira sp. BO4]|nr:hypothetical protein [Nitrospira sp. BO4]